MGIIKISHRKILDAQNQNLIQKILKKTLYQLQKYRSNRETQVFNEANKNFVKKI
jgi:hypothetical protein